MTTTAHSMRIRLPRAAALAAVATVLLAPFAALAWQTAVATADGRAGWWALAVPSGRRLDLLVSSAAMAAAVAIASTAVGTLAALALLRWRRGPAIGRWIALVLAPVPPYLHALGWMRVAPVSLEGWAASWLVETMVLLPLAVGLASIALEGVDPALVDAARAFGSDARALARVVLPLTAPSLWATAALVFVLSLVEYGVPSLFSVNAYALDVFAEYSASGEPVRAFLLALPLALVAAAVGLPALPALRRAASSARRGRTAWSVRPEWPAWLVAVQTAALGALAVQALVPALAVVAAVDAPARLATTALDARREVAFTLSVAALAAAACVALALAVAELLPRGERASRFWWIVLAAPLVVPAPLVGIGLIAIWNHAATAALYDSILTPAHAMVVRFGPVAALVVLGRAVRLDPLLSDAARVFAPNRFAAWARVRLPELAPAVAAAGAVVFVLALGELGATLVVTPAGRSTLAIRIYNYLHYGALDEVARLCVLASIAALIAGLAATAAARSWRGRK